MVYEGVVHMKKIVAFVLIWFCFLAMTGCNQNNTCKIMVTVPAGSQEAFVFSEEAICPTGKKITVACGEGLGDTKVLLEAVEETLTTGYVATDLAPGAPVEFDTDKGTWFKIGVSIQNDTDADRIVYVEVTGVTMKDE